MYEPVVRGVQSELPVPHRVGVPEHRMREGVDTRGLSRARRAADDHVRHVSLLGDNLQTVQRLLVSDHLGCVQKGIRCDTREGVWFVESSTGKDVVVR